MCFIAPLKDTNFCLHRTFWGKEFHTSGPLCLIDLWANAVRGFCKCISKACRVEYEWTALFGWNMCERGIGRRFVLKRNMNRAVCIRLISSTFKHFNLAKSGSVWSRKPDRVHMRTAFFINQYKSYCVVAEIPVVYRSIK